MTPEQVEAARELLGWSQSDVALRVGLSEWVIGFFERGERLIGARNLRRVRSIFESAGVEFVDGVLFRAPVRKTSTKPAYIQAIAKRADEIKKANEFDGSVLHAGGYSGRNRQAAPSRQ